MPATPAIYPTRPRHLLSATVAMTTLLLAACGGGGGGASPTPAAAAQPAAAASAVPAQLSGVAAFGAPLSGATLKIMDAKGQAVGSGSTNQADGSYTLTLTTGTPTMPLMLQAAGFDATGQPLLLHSALSVLPAASAASASASTSALPMAAVVNITPLTDAAVALTLGTEPRKVFAQPATYATQLATLAKLGPASDFVKSLVKTNLADAKASTSVDLFADATFAATKGGVDLALETLSISLGTSAQHRDQLQLTNKLGSKAGEVTVDLANAAAEFAKTTGAVPANAITSTLKVTTSPSALVTRLAALDALAVSVNSAVAAGGTGSAVTALTASYTRHNGRDATALAALIAGWAQQGTQLGRLQVTGCADVVNPATTGTTGTGTTTTTTATLTCTRVAVAARLNDTVGTTVGSFSDVVTYNTASSKWALVGNGQAAEVTVRALAWLALNAEGARLAGQALNPRIGVQLGVQSAAASAAVLTPSNYVLTLVPCGQPWLCINPSAGSSSAVASASPMDQGVFQGTSAWMGVADLSLGANYAFTLTTPGTGVSSTTTTSMAVALRNSFVDAPADSRFPALDDVKTGQPLGTAALLSGSALAWQSWAAANPDMRVTLVRLVLAGATAADAPLVFDVKPERWQSGSMPWAGVTLPDDFGVGGVTLWLLAIDANGRQYATGYAVVAAL